MPGNGRDLFMVGSGGDVEVQERHQRHTGRSTSMVTPVNIISEIDYDNLTTYTGALVARSTTSYADPSYDSEGVSEVIYGRNRDAGVDKFKRVIAKTDHLLRSGPLGMCDDPYCTTCPAAYHAKPKKSSFGSSSYERRFHNVLHGDAKGWMSRKYSMITSYFPIVHPHAKKVQQWNKFFIISCLVAIFIDPLFFFVLSVDETHKCIRFDMLFAVAIAAVRSVTDIGYLLHMILQFRLAYVAPETTVVGSGDFVDEPKKIALHYLRGYFLLDLFVVLPLPQVMILVVIPSYVGTSAANYAKNLLRLTVLLQYTPRIIRFLPLISSQFIFESAWANFVINLLMFVLSGHVVGSCWYLFGLQRVNQCLINACTSNSSTLGICKELIDCGDGRYQEDLNLNPSFHIWASDVASSNCFTTDGFNYGIYQQAVLITRKGDIAVRYIYSLFWGFQIFYVITPRNIPDFIVYNSHMQISTLAGNQIPSSFIWEVLFTMGIIGLGLFLFALLIGNMQNFLQALGRRRLEMQLRQRDVERWMSHRCLSEELRNQVRQAERFNWAATRGVNEEILLENLPENLQRSIRRHLFSFLKKVRIFTLMDDSILDVVYERLRQNLYLKGSNIFEVGGRVEKMIFIARGRLKSIGEDGNASLLSEGDVCGEELLTRYLEHSSVNKAGEKIRFPGYLISNRTVSCETNVEAFALRASDLEVVTILFARLLRNPRVQGAIRYISPYWRTRAAIIIQVAWRYRKRRLSRSNGCTTGVIQANDQQRQ